MLKLKKLVIILNNSIYLNGEPLYREILNKACELDISGGTAMPCLEGFGANTRLKKKHAVNLNSIAPICLQLIDTEEKIALIYPFLEQHLTKGIVYLEDVEVMKFNR